MVICRRGPYLAQGAFGSQTLAAHGVPERASDGARVRPPVENGPYHFHLAGPGIAMFAHIAVEAQRAVVSALTHALLLQKVNGKNRCVSAVAAAEGKGPIS